ncbi:cryptochrome/photolyase family protein [Actinokineospora bangkokensis]|uniref:Deoxyribodipyrimidine photolyase n=2 Tax=Actinokineospora bangkokensis TaxID=1193682 RepID=A0A1Q9LD14_9PSEU|nr:deoxyribodipyrimidine photo-lyase [Actinokineospora bangkokensis]OLR89895.1 deoxyribodipyrimidine photolyase [Actinokineospora bangkokensis]
MAASPAIVWFRRDLRLGDHPALLEAADRAGSAVALYVLDDALRDRSGAPRLDFLYGCLRALDDQLGGRLLVVHGDPVDAVPRVARAFGAGSVHVSADAGPYGRRRDERVEQALGDVELVRTGSPYAVTPGRVTKDDGTPFKVFTPFSRAWARHGWRAPASTSKSTVEWVDPGDKSGGPRRVRVPTAPAHSATLPEPGERAALEHWSDFLEGPLRDYKRDRDKPGVDGTSRMSAYLRWGCVHPRTLLADLAGHSGDGPDTYRTELAWRDFYADVLWNQPRTARENFNERFDAIEHDSGPHADEHHRAWAEGRTGFPIVDAGMRQLLAEGWVHNRVRMIVASFYAKDLHLPWWRGARHFMQHLVDGDLASNQHGWQWTAGSGTDASPYFRVFNPTTQAEKFDPTGDYVRKYVPELRGIEGKKVHQPQDNPPNGYPTPIVDHAHERQVALDRYNKIKA